MNKILSFFPNGNNSIKNRHSASLEPELGFQLVFEPPSSNNNNSNQRNVSQLHVHLIAARHLPSSFGFKNVQGYVVKVKLFPGITKYDSCIQTSSWPKFNENFKFPLEPEKKSSIKTYFRGNESNSSENLPEKIFCGHFVVFTMYALLELPPGNFNRLNKTYRSLKDRSSSIIQRIAEQSNDIKTKQNQNETKDATKEKEEPLELTKSESRRNIGSVTCYLDPKIFKRNVRNNDQFNTEELWYPIRDLTASTSKNGVTNNTALATKGQLEIILELCDVDKEPSIASDHSEDKTSTKKEDSNRKQWSISEVKRKLSTRRNKKSTKNLVLKVSTTKMRCSIKVKDEFEETAGQIYIKTTVLKDDIPISSWKCEHFIPSLSSRWDPNSSTVVAPINEEDSLEHMSVKTTVSSKTKVGKKIVLGTIILGPNSLKTYSEHWKNALSNKNQPVAMWHSFQ